MAATTGAIRAGRAFVEIFTDDTKLQKGLKTASQRMRAFGASVSAIGQKLLALGAAGAGAFAVTIKAASDLQEVMSKFDTVFGEQAEAAKKWGDEFAAQVGRSKRQVAEFLAGSQDLFVPLGFDPQRAQELSKQVTALAVDLASFNNKADADTMRDLQAALTGSGEVMKKYGVIVNETAVKQELLNMGLDPTNATQIEKVMARLNIIMAGTTAAQGDAVRTADSFANQTKRLRAQLEDTAGTIGTALLPVVTPLVAEAAKAAQKFSEWAGENQETIVTLGKIVAGLLATGGALAAFGQASILASGAVNGFGAALKFAQANAAILGPALLAIGFAAITIQVMKSTEAMQAFANEMQRVLSLTRQFDQRRAKEQSGILEQARGIEDPEERKAFIQDQIELARKNLAGANSQRRASEQDLLDAKGNIVQNAHDLLGMNHRATDARQKIAEATSKAESLQAFIDDLESIATNADRAPDAPASKPETAPGVPFANSGVGTGVGFLKPSDWDKVVKDLQGGMFAAMGAAAAGGGTLAPFDMTRHMPDLGGIGSFSANARQFDDGVGKKALEWYETMAGYLAEIRRNTEDRGIGID